MNAACPGGADRVEPSHRDRDAWRGHYDYEVPVAADGTEIVTAADAFEY